MSSAGTTGLLFCSDSPCLLETGASDTAEWLQPSTTPQPKQRRGRHSVSRALAAYIANIGSSNEEVGDPFDPGAIDSDYEADLFLLTLMITGCS